MKNFKMYCKKGIDSNGCVDEFLISLFFEVDDEIVDSCEFDNIGDILFESNEMLNRNCEKYCFDGRFDKLEIDLKYKW